MTWLWHLQQSIFVVVFGLFFVVVVFIVVLFYFGYCFLFFTSPLACVWFGFATLLGCAGGCGSAIHTVACQQVGGYPWRFEPARDRNEEEQRRGRH